MLVTMQSVFSLGVAHSQPRLHVNIIIHSVNIGVCMMDHIMLCSPHMLACAKETGTIGCKIIDPFVAAETSVSAVMHHIEPDGCNQAAHHYRFCYGNSPMWSEEYKVNIYGDKTRNKQTSLDIQFVIAGLALPFLIKVF